MDGLSTVGGVVGLAVQVATTAKKIYDFINSVKDSPKEFKKLAQELETIHSILTSWVKETKFPPNEHIENAIRACESHLTELDQLVSKYRLQDGSKRREQMIRGLKGTFGKKKVQEIQVALESTKSTLQLAIASALHSNIQLIYQQLRVSTSWPAYVSSTQLNAILQETQQQHAGSEFQIPNVGAIENDVESISEELARNTGILFHPACFAHRVTSRHSPTSIQSAISSLVDEEIRQQSTKVGDEIDHVIRKKCRERLLPLGYMEDECQNYSRLDGISHVTREYGGNFQGLRQNRQVSRSQNGSKTMKIRRSRKNKFTLPLGGLTKPRLVNTKTKWMRINKTPFGTLILRCDIRVISDDVNNSHTIEFSSAFIPNSQLSLTASLYSISMAHRGWSILPAFNFQQFNIVPSNSTIFSLIKNGGDAMELRELLCFRKASPFDVDEHGWTPLHRAAYYERYDLCKILIDYGGKVNADLGDGSPLLHLFEGGGFAMNLKNIIKILRLLLTNDADPCQMTSSGLVPFACAGAINGKDFNSSEMLQLLIPYKDLNEVFLLRELYIDDDTNDYPDVPVPWWLYIVALQLSERTLTANYLDGLKYLGAKFAQCHSDTLSLNTLLLNGLHPFESRIAKVALLKKGVELCPSTHHIGKRDCLNSSTPSCTPTTAAYDMGLFEPWLEALIQSGENIKKFLEDDLKIMEDYGIHLWRCDIFDSEKDPIDSANMKQTCTCGNLYFVSLFQFFRFDQDFGRWFSRGDLGPEPVEAIIQMYRWFWPDSGKLLNDAEESWYRNYWPYFENIARSRVEDAVEDRAEGGVEYEPLWSLFKRRCWFRWRYEIYMDAHDQQEKDIFDGACYRKTANEDDQWHDPFGGALRSKWGEFVLEIDKLMIALLFTTWILFQQTLVIERLVNQASSFQHHPRNILPTSQKSSNESQTNVSNETGAKTLLNLQDHSNQTKPDKKPWFRRLRKWSKAT